MAQTTQSLKYSDRIRPKKDEEIAEQDLQFKVKQARLQLQADKLATEQSIAEAQKKLESAKGHFPLASKTILQYQDELNALEKGYAALIELEEELF